VKSTRIALAVAGAFLLAACGSSGDSPQGEATPVVKAEGSVAAVVDTSKSGCDPHKSGNCWLPLYRGSGFKHTAVNVGGSCSHSNEIACWPQPGDRLTVVCSESGGQKLSDSTGRETTLWLGVAIPRERVLTPRFDPELDGEGRAVVFVSSLWVRPLSEGQFPDCTTFFTNLDRSKR